MSPAERGGGPRRGHDRRRSDGPPSSRGRNQTGGSSRGGRDQTGGMSRGGRDQAGGSFRGGRDQTGGSSRAGRDQTGGMSRGGRDQTGGSPRGGRNQAGGLPPAARRQGGGSPRSGRGQAGGGHAGGGHSAGAAAARPMAGEQVEGRQAVRELLAAGRRRVHSVLVAETAGAAVDELIDLADDAGVPVRRVSRQRIDELAGTDAPQGVVALADPLPEPTLEEVVAAAGATPLLVVLDGVTDPHNLGAVLRSALAAGAHGVVVGRHRAAALGPAAVKAAAGAAEWLPVATVAGIPAALAELQAAGIWTVGLDADGTTPLWDLELASEPIALVLGAEGQGLSRLARQRCEAVVSIPMLGPLASLNVSAAAALACFEVARRRAR